MCRRTPTRRNDSFDSWPQHDPLAQSIVDIAGIATEDVGARLSNRLPSRTKVVSGRRGMKVLLQNRRSPSMRSSKLQGPATRLLLPMLSGWGPIRVLVQVNR